MTVHDHFIYGSPILMATSDIVLLSITFRCQNLRRFIQHSANLLPRVKDSDAIPGAFTLFLRFLLLFLSLRCFTIGFGHILRTHGGIGGGWRWKSRAVPWVRNSASVRPGPWMLQPGHSPGRIYDTSIGNPYFEQPRLYESRLDI